MPLSDNDKPFLDALRLQASALKQAFDSIGAETFPTLEGIEVTKAVLHRMRTYSNAQSEIKELLNKRYATPAADFFVETVLFYLMLYCKSISDELEVHSERQIKPKRGQMRPDISVWRNNEVLSIVECKTQLGWNRGNWERDFLDRERRLRAQFPNAKAFLLVMTEGNWGGFSTSDTKVGKQYFALLRRGVSPDALSEENFQHSILNPIEGLFSEIVRGHNGV